MIYTSYFAQIRNFPKNVIPIAICGGLPHWYEGLWYRKLAPKYKFFMEWKENQDNEFYIKHFNDEVLDVLDFTRVITDLQLLIPIEIREKMTACVASDPNWHIALICYEKPTDFCHRHLVADWFKEHGVPVTEWQKGPSDGRTKKSMAFDF